MTKGGKNLVILGIGSIIIATVTTVGSLLIYHNSGDIYLDRSRPGFLPDDVEIEEDEQKNNNYEFSKSGKIDKEILKEYLENMKQDTSDSKRFDDPFGEKAISNETLGIPNEE